MNVGANLGEKIYQASTFVNDVYKQVQQLLFACDTAFDRVGIVPASGSEVELHRARNLYAPEAWSQQAVGRLYIPRKRFDGTVTVLFVVEVHLRPKIATHALLVLAYAESQPLATPQALASSYGESDWLEELLRGRYPEQTEWRGDRVAHPRHIPLTDYLYLKAWPLMEITDEDAVSTILVAQMRTWAPEADPILWTGWLASFYFVVVVVVERLLGWLFACAVGLDGGGLGGRADKLWIACVKRAHAAASRRSRFARSNAAGLT